MSALRPSADSRREIHAHRTIRFSQGAILYQLWARPHFRRAIFEPPHEFGLASATSY
jgi:hypothetical protein